MSVLFLVNENIPSTTELANACLPNVSFLLYDPAIPSFVTCH